MEVLKNKVAIKHAIADLLYGDKDEGEYNFQCDPNILKEVISDIQNGEQIFKSPEIDYKLKTTKLLKIGD